MWTLRNLTIHDFGLIEEARLDFQDITLAHVSGVNADVPGASSNMAGKSTLLKALTWALYESDTIGAPIYADAIRDGQSSCAVEVDFTSDDGRIVHLVRERYKSPPPGVSTVTLRVNAESGPAAQLQAAVDSMFGPKQLFLAAHIFGYDEEYVPFAKLSDREQKGLFDLLISAEDLAIASARTESRMVVVDLALDRLTAWLGRAKSRHVALQAAYETRTVLLAAATDEHKLDEDKSRRTYDEARTAYRNCQNRASDSDRMRRTLQTQVDASAALIRRIEDALRRYAGLEDAQTTQVDNAETNCPACGAAYSPERMQEIRAELQAKLDETRKRIADATSERSDCAGKHEKLVRQLTKVQECAEADARAEQEAWSVLIKAKTEHEAAKAQVVAAKERQQAAGLSKVFVAAAEDLVAELARQEQRLQEQREDLEFWKRGFGPAGVRAYRLDAVTPVLNRIAARHSNTLFGDGTHVTYSTQTRIKSGELRDRFSVALSTREGEPITRPLSAGQAMRRDLVHLFSVVDLAEQLGKRTVRFLAFDEAFRTVDSTGKEAVLEILRGYARDCPVLCVEHDDELAALFAQRIIVRRGHGVAQVEVER